MKKTIATLTAALFTTVALAVQVGQPAPNFTGTDIHGKTVKLSDYKGKVVVLETFNPDCPFCHLHYRTGATQELQKDYTSKGVVWLVVDSVAKKNPSYRTDAQAQELWKKLNMHATDWINDASGTIGHLYDMQTTPQMFVINRQGTLVYDGAMDNNPRPFGNPRKAKNYVRAALNSVLAGKPVAIPETKPYGCSVKYAH